MKKYLLFLPFLALLAACKSNEPLQTKSVTFNISTFEQTTEPLKAPAAVILDDENGSALTDIFIFDGDNQVAHQTSDADDFGTIKLPLTHGEHNLHFVATRSSGITVSGGSIFATSLRSTFGKHLALNVTGTTDDQNIELDRITGMLRITILDEFPANAAEIEFIINKRYTTLRVEDFQGFEAEGSNTVRTSCTSKVGKSGEYYTLCVLSPILNTPYYATVTINAYNAGGDNIASVTVNNVQMCSNTKTLLNGNLFNMPSANISVNTEWEEDIVVGF